MQRQSSTQIGNGVPNSGTSVNALDYSIVGKKPIHKTKTQTNLNYVDKTQLGKYELQVDYQAKLSRLKLQKCYSLQLN